MRDQRCGRPDGVVRRRTRRPRLCCRMGKRFDLYIRCDILPRPSPAARPRSLLDRLGYRLISRATAGWAVCRFRIVARRVLAVCRARWRIRYSQLPPATGIRWAARATQPWRFSGPVPGAACSEYRRTFYCKRDHRTAQRDFAGSCRSGAPRCHCPHRPPAVRRGDP